MNAKRFYEGKVLCIVHENKRYSLDSPSLFFSEHSKKCNRSIEIFIVFWSSVIFVRVIDRERGVIERLGRDLCSSMYLGFRNWTGRPVRGFERLGFNEGFESLGLLMTMTRLMITGVCCCSLKYMLSTVRSFVRSFVRLWLCMYVLRLLLLLFLPFAALFIARASNALLII